MQDFHEVLFRRHSIRKYTAADLSADDLKTIVEAALLAPTSRSLQPCKFVVVDDPATIRALAKCKPSGTTPLNTCRVAIVVLADPTKSDVWVEDSAVAATYIQLQAEMLGLGSCWVQVRRRTTDDERDAQEIVKEVLEVPDNYQVLCIITLGHKDEVKAPTTPEQLLWEKVQVNKYVGEE